MPWSCMIRGSITRHYEVAFPLRVGKIWKAPPKEKGQIPDEATLVKDYLYLGTC